MSSERAAKTGEIRAFFFDFDGVLVDTETPWAESIYHFCQDRKLGLDRKTLLSYVGDGDVLVLERLCALTGMEREEILGILREDYRQAEGQLSMRPGAKAFLEAVKGRGLKLALVSNSGREYIDQWLEKLSLTGFFDCVVTRDDEPRPKPAPDLYLRALRLLGLEPGQVIAVEDSAMGLRAAVSAGVRAAAFPNPATIQTEAGTFFPRVDLAKTTPAELMEQMLR